MAKRVKSKEPAIISIETWDKADEHIRSIGDLQLKINQAEASAKDAIDEAKAELVESVKPLQSAIELHHRSLEAFAAARKDDFAGQKSRKLNFGLLGWRKSTVTIIKKNTLELIKALFPAAKAKAYIHTKETVDKEALAKLTDQELADISARRESKDVFFVEPDLPKAVDYVQ